MIKKKTNSIAVNIGNNAESITLAHEKVMDILNSKNDQETTRCALGVFEKGLKIDGTVIRDCHFSMGDQ